MNKTLKMIESPTIEEALQIISPLIAEQKKAYYEANKDKIDEQQKAYREAKKLGLTIKSRRQKK